MKISFLSPLYNAEKWINNMLDSIYNNIPTGLDYEVILIDDCSTDNTRKILNELNNKYFNLSIEFHNENKGSGFTYNELIEKATGDYIAIIDCDDMYLPTIKDVLIQVDGEYDIYYYDYFTKEGNILKKTPQDGYNRCANFKIVKKSFINKCNAKYNDGAHGDWFYNKILVDNNPKCKYTNIVAYYFNSPREGSQTWDYERGKK
jgi:glycosyltransferase involved in cell wall biosynthesis